MRIKQPSSYYTEKLKIVYKKMSPYVKIVSDYKANERKFMSIHMNFKEKLDKRYSHASDKILSC